MNEILANLEQFKWRRRGCAYRATVWTKLGSGAVVSPVSSANPYTQWRVAVCGTVLVQLFDTPTQAKKAARAEWTRQHMALLA